jgi:hypothetical protein
MDRAVPSQAAARPPPPPASSSRRRALGPLRASFVTLTGALGNLFLAPRLLAPWPLFSSTPPPEEISERSTE